MQKVLVDSNIFLDYYLDRRDGMLPLGEFAFQFIKRALECEFFLIVCRECVEEVSFSLGVNEEDVYKKVLKELIEKHKLEVIDPSPKIKETALIASRKRNIPYNDALFAFVSKEIGVAVITRDKHFFELKDIATAIKPEEL